MVDEFWFSSPLTLEEVGECLAGEFRFSDAKFDREDPYEWLEATTPDGLRLNVSRNRPGDAESFRISASGSASVGDFGRRLATCLRTTVHYYVAYIGNNHLEYGETARLEPGE
jgi:hypothetical protein